MGSVNVLITSGAIGSISEECLQKIANISPRIRLTDASDLFAAEKDGDLTAKDKLDVLLAETEVIYGDEIPRNVITRAPKLKWFQVKKVGVDEFLDTEMMESPVMLTNVSGINADTIGEFVLGRMLMFAQQAPVGFQLQQEKQWKHFTKSMLRSKTVGIVGLGNIGREVGRLAKAFGMRVLATTLTKPVERAKSADIMLSSGQLLQLLTESDFVVLSVPSTPRTKSLIGEKELRAMKPSAYLINIARGDLVDEKALIRALDEHWIAGAGLDVVATEPLSSDSKLWEFPNIIFSPHIAGNFEDGNEQATEVFSKNLRSYLEGKKLFNVVNKKQGY